MTLTKSDSTPLIVGGFESSGVSLYVPQNCAFTCSNSSPGSTVGEVKPCAPRVGAAVNAGLLMAVFVNLRRSSRCRPHTDRRGRRSGRAGRSNPRKAIQHAVEGT